MYIELDIRLLQTNSIGNRYDPIAYLLPEKVIGHPSKQLVDYVTLGFDGHQFNRLHAKTTQFDEYFIRAIKVESRDADSRPNLTVFVNYSKCAQE